MNTLETFVIVFSIVYGIFFLIDCQQKKKAKLYEPLVLDFIERFNLDVLEKDFIEGLKFLLEKDNEEKMTPIFEIALESIIKQKKREIAYKKMINLAGKG